MLHILCLFQTIIYQLLQRGKKHLKTLKKHLEILSTTWIWRHITFHKSVNHSLWKSSLENSHRPKLVEKTDFLLTYNPIFFVHYIYIYIIYKYILYTHIYIYIYIYIKNETFCSKRVIYQFLPNLRRLNKIAKGVESTNLKTD